MQISEYLAIFSGLIHTLAYLDYNRQVIKGGTKPNGATWLIWSAIALVSTTSYIKATGDIWKSVIPFLNVTLCILTLILAICMKKFKRPDNMDFLALGIGLIAAAVWKIYGSATYGNLIVQFAILSGFVPTWRSIKSDPDCEKPRPWWIWTFGYSIAVIVVIIRWKGQWSDLAYPINSILLHTSVAVLGKFFKKIN